MVAARTKRALATTWRMATIMAAMANATKIDQERDHVANEKRERQNRQQRGRSKLNLRKVSKTTRCGKELDKPRSITENPTILDDDLVAIAIACVIPEHPAVVREIMSQWERPILKTVIPGNARKKPSLAMLEVAKKKVRRFFKEEDALGLQSDVVKAFLLASGEKSLRFDWTSAMDKIKRATFDLTNEVDSWDECLAMTIGDTNALCEIFVCGTKCMSQRVLTSLLCHEALHNLARRTRRGNSYLSEDIEHVAMALLGDPQLVYMELDPRPVRPHPI